MTERSLAHRTHTRAKLNGVVIPRGRRHTGCGGAFSLCRAEAIAEPVRSRAAPYLPGPFHSVERPCRKPHSISRGHHSHDRPPASRRRPVPGNGGGTRKPRWPARARPCLAARALVRRSAHGGARRPSAALEPTRRRESCPDASEALPGNGRMRSPPGVALRPRVGAGNVRVYDDGAVAAAERRPRSSGCWHLPYRRTARTRCRGRLFSRTRRTDDHTGGGLYL